MRVPVSISFRLLMGEQNPTREGCNLIPLLRLVSVFAERKRSLWDLSLCSSNALEPDLRNWLCVGV